MNERFDSWTYRKIFALSSCHYHRSTYRRSNLACQQRRLMQGKKSYSPDIPPEVWQRIIRHATVVSGVLKPELPPSFGATSSDRDQVKEFKRSLVGLGLPCFAVFCSILNSRSRGEISYGSARHGTLLRHPTSLNMSFLVVTGVFNPFVKR